MQKIDIDINNLPLNARKFIKNTLETCSKYNIPITLSNTYTVTWADIYCAGYFEEDPLQFATACAGHYNYWLRVFVHESCHMDQWIEKSDLWTFKIPGFVENPTTIFDKWITKKIEISDDIKETLINYIVNVELDCERRSIDKIRKFDLPIDINTYIRQGNTYIWSYRLIGETRDFECTTIYSTPQIWKHMPTHFNNDYSKIPDNMRVVFANYKMKKFD